jgi:formylglycine-generating enzyme required for sulfatase activity
MVLIPGGEFLMGSPAGQGSADEHPAHKVTLDPYFIDAREVTWAQYTAFADAVKRKMEKRPFRGRENFPVVYVTWNDAEAYCGHYGKRLPTEAEWENAARGGSAGRFCFGDEAKFLGGYAWYWDNSGKALHPVGQKKPNAYGVYDMHGNALEWVSDWYDEDYYAASPAWNPQGPAEGKEKVFRGGSVFVSADLCRSAARMHGSHATAYSGKSFRCAASLNR